MPEGRPYQTAAVAHVRACEATGKIRLCLQGPTGSGKTWIMARLLSDPVPQYVLTHRRVLVDQLCQVLSAAGIEYGIRGRGYRPNSAAPIQIGLYQSENSRVFKSKQWAMHGAARLHIDEWHSIRGDVAQKISRAYYNAGASLIGYTATPRGLAEVCDEVYPVATVTELIRDGYLVPPEIYTPDGPDMERLGKVKRDVNGEYSAKGLAKIMPPKVIFGSMLGHWQALNPTGKPSVLFAPSVAASLWFAQRLAACGVPAAHLDGKQIWLEGEYYDSTSENRAQVFQRLRDGRLKILTNRFVLREGWDCPEVEFVILATSFGSRVSFVQACGRGLRTSPGKSRCMFLDHGGNFWQHPPLDSDWPWDWSEREYIAARTNPADPNRPKAPEPIVCPNCNVLRVSGPECPACGHASITYGRNVLMVDGMLKRVTGPIWKPKKTKPIEQKIWEGSYWGARKRGRTLSQAYSWARKQLNWAELPRTMKYMPRRDDDWVRLASEVPFSELY